MTLKFRWMGLWALMGIAMGMSTLHAADNETPAAKKGSFIVHEWGTFTALQDDNGKELPGINIDDEPVPAFVHNLAPYLLNNPILTNEHWIYRQKGAPRQHPMITMRLETPVLYFYPGADGKLPASVDVDVRFRGGWLTEFYPYARAFFSTDGAAGEIPGQENSPFDFGPLTPDTIGRLTWSNVKLDTRKEGPRTDSHVWLAPREVKSVDLTVHNPNAKNKASDESERYLFYRGVANQNAPLRVTTDRKAQQVAIHSNFSAELCKTECQIDAAWLVDIRANGKTAFRTIDAFKVTADRDAVSTKVSKEFSEGDYSSTNMDQLQDAMHKALVNDGLNKDEATAMLATWRRAYFKTPGTRVFFLVPQRWTDHYLPIEISGRPVIDRVMMGRIELISTEQRVNLAKLAEGPISDGKWVNSIPEGAAKEEFLSGRSNFGDLGVKIPADYQAYLDLGRFRNALVVAEQKRTGSPTLAKFINTYRIQPYRIASN